MAINIPLSKQGRKYRGEFIAQISDEDKALAELDWSACVIKNRSGVYATREKQTMYLHRAIAERMFGEIPEGYEVDHIDRNPLNNQRDNLRLAKHGQNKANSKRYKNNKSGFKGVHRKGNKWRAQITFQRKVIYLGAFDTREEAYAAYCKKAEELQGEFWNPG